MDDLKEHALRYALVYAEETRTEDIAKKVTLERFNLELNAVMKKIGGDYSNTSILMSKHGEQCKNKMEIPTARFREWL